MKRSIHRLALPTLAAVALLVLGLGPPSTALADRHLAACAADRNTCILEAIDDLEPGAVGQWTKSGKPKVAAIEVVAGIDISAAERDAAWSEFESWKANRRELDDLKAALVIAETDRDRYEEDAARLQVEVDDLRIDLRRAELAARNSADDARVATARAEAAEAKTRALLSGAPVCSEERAVVRADDSWRASSLRKKVDKLLACLKVGEGA